jgi:hypothetical protein
METLNSNPKRISISEASLQLFAADGFQSVNPIDSEVEEFEISTPELTQHDQVLVLVATRNKEKSLHSPLSHLLKQDTIIYEAFIKNL